MAITKSQSGIEVNLPYTVYGEAATFTAQASNAIDYETGTAASQVDKVFVDKVRNLAATSEELDLAGGLTDPDGAAITFVKVREIQIVNLSTVAGETLKVGGAAANAFLLFDNATDIQTIGPGGSYKLQDPIDGRAVTAGTGDKLKIDSGAATLNYSIVIAGTSA